MASCKTVLLGLQLVCLLLLLTVSVPVTGRRRAKPPLIEDTPKKRPQRPSHCQFGNQTLEIEERWRPNLGPPFGTLVCVRCECVAVARKNRIVARVKCRNIKNECPKPTCENPVLLPEHCCKTCPGEDLSAVEDMSVRKLEHEDDEGKEFSVLMTGKGLQPSVATDFTARGYFSFSKRNLQYFFNYSGTEQPSFIRFTNEDRNILEEHEVTSASRPDGLVAGKLLKHDLLHTEVFSALLGAPGKQSGGGNSGPEAGSGISSSITSGGTSGGGMSFPSSCTLLRKEEKENANTLQRNGNYLDDEANDILVSESAHKCYYEGEILEDGSQWKSSHMDCQMCSCQKGRVKCDRVMCPTLDCAEPVSVPGECCPTCDTAASQSTNNNSSSRGCFFEGDKQFHGAGTKWHPYLPPFGFDRCSLCTCRADTLNITCQRNVACPPLSCPEYEAFRENPMDCCKRCPVVVPVKAISTDQLGDQRSSSVGISPNELIAGGGCRFKSSVYPNGYEWHPTVQPFGEVKFVSCHCKDGIAKCRRIKEAN